ncbi:DUF1531-domain-containing protein [Byssothecium circinans]|uniref:DUF1531-domain-containing protein n=1 Tax=Byssothecium circinans TaxID=147558 RepID=A0A6A5UP71_9PLEO|nr:DUF1531-domain-containing protein [Byssothecium circinans]
MIGFVVFFRYAVRDFIDVEGYKFPLSSKIRDCLLPISSTPQASSYTHASRRPTTPSNVSNIFADASTKFRTNAYPHPSPTMESLPSLLSTWKDNFIRNGKGAFTTMDTKAWIRLVIIVGTYCLIRPYLMKLGARLQQRQHEHANAENTSAAVHPNELRTGKKYEIPGVEEDSDEDGDDNEGANWGRNARVRQRKFIRNALEKEEKRLRDEQEAESDKEIEDLLVD